jgi:uncharacterized protein
MIMTPLHPFRVLIVLVVVALSCAAGSGADRAAEKPGKVRVLLVHGGHDFETNQFLQVFRDNPKISFTTVEHPKAQEWFRPERAGDYDVLVFYDMWHTISEQGKADLVSLLKAGKPLVALHHTLAAFQKWDEYANIIGGRYHQAKWSQGGVEKPASTYEHDVDFTVRVSDPNHPVTRGIRDFRIHDEVYGGFEVKPESHILLTTDEPKNGRDLGWWKTYGQARIVYLQLGHDHQAYENPNYRKLVAQAIDWAAHGTR